MGKVLKITRKKINQADGEKTPAAQNAGKSAKPEPTQPGLTPREELRYCLDRFKTTPARRLAKRSLKVSEDHDEWTTLSLVGLYLRSFEDRFFKKWSGSAVGLMALKTDMDLLVKRIGVDDARSAIEAVFSSKMKWINGNHMGLLLNQDAYTKFVIPAMESLGSSNSGEQSEWAGKRSNPTCKEIKL